MAYEMFPPRRRLCFNKNINNVNTQPWSTGQLSWLWTRHTQMGINMDMGSSFWLPRALPEFMQKYVFFCAGHFSHNNQSKIKWHSKRRSPSVQKKDEKNCDFKLLQETCRGQLWPVRHSVIHVWAAVGALESGRRRTGWPLAYVCWRRATRKFENSKVRTLRGFSLQSISNRPKKMKWSPKTCNILIRVKLYSLIQFLED